jgi:hypothetical protein
LEEWFDCCVYIFIATGNSSSFPTKTRLVEPVPTQRPI